MIGVREHDPGGHRKVGSQLPGSESMAGIVGGWERTPVVLAGRYRLEELIGRGGTGEVWRGHDLRPGWPVAVKILSPEVRDISMRERFAREARTAARVVHLNVVTVFDVGEHEGRPFLVMELLAGRDLATELAENGPLSISAMCRLAGQVAAGLDAAHRAGVVHRDVKPANLHQSADGVLKVVDFGTARVATEAAMRMTSVGSVIGTAAYLSPEQILGEPGTAASDLYALGCVCYELLCGRPPFTGPAPQLISQHVHDLPDPPSRYRPDIPVELERLVLALLEKDPAARPASGEIVRRALTEIAHRVASHARDRARDTAVFHPAESVPVPSAWTAKITAGRLRERLPGRNAGIALGAAGVVAAVMAAAVWTSAPSDPSGRAAAAIPSETPSAVPSPAASRTVPASPSPPPGRTAPPRSDPGGWRARLLALSRAVSDQERQGGIDSKLARKIREKISKVGRKIEEGDGKGARDELLGIGRELVKARGKGELASEGPLTAFLRDSGLDLASGGDHRPGKGDKDDRDD
ncbi:serine/threonine-protein kinase [Streptosporangium album]|uniref:non-specific serine/threonine protein kinase n=1 Tax=Streptosporangium album TaxID=47479 RepID=A0A7W7RZC1_9ACTN|nr:serine/threonine-protein kinase [Streptosporangium album]MBB4941013.1 serine/threonine-protein kinase [Streptosporangium album]